MHPHDPVLAEAADVLSDQLLAHTRRLGALIRAKSPIDRRFEACLTKLGFSPEARAALISITPGAAARSNGLGKSPQNFFAQVEETGRTLANLNVSPSDVARALHAYDGLLAPVLAKAPVREQANLRWVREQLQSCILLTLNNAYYHVREAETNAFFGLFRAELEASTLDVLLQRFLDTMLAFCGASAARLYLLSSDFSRWQLRAHTNDSGADPVSILPATASSKRALLKPAYRDGNPNPRVPLDKSWRKSASYGSVPLARGRTLQGVMQFAFAKRRKWLPRELELLSAAGERCLMAAEKAKLVQDLEQRQEQLSALSGRMLEVEEMERRRISRELHDGPGQDLVVIRLQLEMVENSFEPGSEARTRLGEVRDLTEKTIIDIRRLISELSPAVLQQLGLGAALRQMVNRFRQSNSAHVRLNLGKLAVVGPKFGIVVYRLVQECLSNIAKHSSATHVNISLTTADRKLRLTVEDDGIGFQLEESANSRGGLGLVGLQERVSILGGEFRIESRKAGNNRTKQSRTGTLIEIELPVPLEK